MRVGGIRVLDRVVEALAQATDTPPVLIANAPDAGVWKPGLKVIPDVEPGLGSLGGILTAVETMGGEGRGGSGRVGDGVICVAWDMPFVSASLLAVLGSMLQDADAAIPESDSRRGLEPLCAAYGPACGPAIRKALARGDRRAIAFHEDIRLARLTRERVLQYGDPGVLFFNVNTPEDLTRAELLCRPPG